MSTTVWTIPAADNPKPRRASSGLAQCQLPLIEDVFLSTWLQDFKESYQETQAAEVGTGNRHGMQCEAIAVK
jgi:hypothetical protein